MKICSVLHASHIINEREYSVFIHGVHQLRHEKTGRRLSRVPRIQIIEFGRLLCANLHDDEADDGDHNDRAEDGRYDRHAPERRPPGAEESLTKRRTGPILPECC